MLLFIFHTLHRSCQHLLAKIPKPVLSYSSLLTQGGRVSHDESYLLELGNVFSSNSTFASDMSLGPELHVYTAKALTHA